MDEQNISVVTLYENQKPIAHLSAILFTKNDAERFADQLAEQWSISPADDRPAYDLGLNLATARLNEAFEMRALLRNLAVKGFFKRNPSA
jgi:hypothetical protein